MSDPDQQIDTDAVRRFWDERARRFRDQDAAGLSNLESDPTLVLRKHHEERIVLEEYVRARPSDVLLDLGAGHGAWTANFAPQVSHIDCVEYSREMADIARDHLTRLGVRNAAVHCVAAQDYVSERKYDTILVSGLLIYLNDADLARLLRNMAQYSQRQAKVVLRDGTARDAPFTIKNKYSTELDSHYSAHYRTADEYIEWFSKFGFELVRHRDMFPAGSPLNKRKETILRIYEFSRAEHNE